MAGWVLHDLAVFLTSGEPAAAAALVPRSLALVAAGAIAGASWARWRWLLPAALPVLAVAAVLPRFVEREVPQLTTWLLRSVLVLALALAAAAFVHGRWRSGALRTGLAAGLSACVATASLRVELAAPSWFLLGAVLALPVLGTLGRPALRRGATWLAVGIAAFPVVSRASRDARVARPEREPGSARAEPGAPNLLLVVLDTVRAGRLAPYGYERVTTPALDAFARDHATRYTSARSTSSWTLPSHASLFTGLLPAQHGATHPRRGDGVDTVTSGRVPAQRMRPDVPTLAEVLRDAGYRTGGVLGNFVYLDHRFGLDRGYEHWDARPGAWVGGYLPLAQMAGAPPQPGHRPYRDARTITDRALAWLGAEGDERPFFLTVNYMDAHGPYLPPAPFDLAFTDEVPVDLLRPPQGMHSLQYDRELQWLDSQLKRLLEGLERSGRFEDTVVVVTSDHGEALGDHGLPAHNWTLYEEVVHVPLYVKPAGPRTVESRDEPVTGADVFRIALDALGLEPPEMARSDAAVTAEWYLRKGEVEQPERTLTGDLVSWLEPGRKVIVSSDGRVEAYDLAGDPGELAPLPLSEDEVAAALLRARTWWEENPPPEPSGLDPEGGVDLDRLRVLGYAGSP